MAEPSETRNKSIDIIEMLCHIILYNLSENCIILLNKVKKLRVINSSYERRYHNSYCIIIAAAQNIVRYT